MTCGDSATAWVPSGGTSVWVGTIDSDVLVVVLTDALAQATSVVGGLPASGFWSHGVGGTHWTAVAVLAGRSWTFNVHATECNETGDVVALAGNAVDALDGQHPVTMTRTA